MNGSMGMNAIVKKRETSRDFEQTQNGGVVRAPSYEHAPSYPEVMDSVTIDSGLPAAFRQLR
jgi:hypothetical protein